MIRKLTLSLTVMFGMATATVAQNVTLTINPNPTITDAKVKLTGTNQAFPGWGVTTDSILVVVIPKAGGLSRTYPAQNGTQPGEWTCTTPALPPRTYLAFAIATAAPVASTQTAMVGGGGDPTPVPSPQSICSPVIEFQQTNVLTTPLPDDAPWFEMTYDATSPRRVQELPMTAKIIAAGSLTNTATPLDRGSASKPILVQLPSTGGEFVRSEAAANLQVAQNGYIWSITNTDTPELPLQPKHNVYAFVTVKRKNEQGVETGEIQLICTPMKSL